MQRPLQRLIGALGPRNDKGALRQRALGRLPLLALAVLGLACYQMPGWFVHGWLVQSEFVVGVVAEAVPEPALPADVPGLRAIDCRPGPPVAPGGRGRPAMPGDESTHTCHYRFGMDAPTLLERRDFSLLELIEQTLGAAAASRVTWTTREVFLGSEQAAEILPDAVNLLVWVGLALLLGWRPAADLAQLRALGTKRHWPTAALWCSPLMVLWFFSSLRRWGPESLTPLLWSTSAITQKAGWLASDLFRGCVAAPMVEELVYRVWLIPLLARIVNPHVAVMLSAAAFSWSHGQAYLAYFAVGIAFGYLWLVFRNGLLCMAIHAAGNLGPVLFMRDRFTWLPGVHEVFSP